MKKTKYLVFAGFIAAVASACGQPQTAQTKASQETGTLAEETTEGAAGTEKTNGIKTITLDELKEGTQLIDVREEEQYIGWDTAEGKGGHIPEAVDFPESWIMQDPETYAIGTNIENELARRGLDPSMPVVLYDNGTVSEETAGAYAGIGFSDISVLDGGFNAYVDAGRETEKLSGYTTLVYPDWVQALINGETPEGYDGGEYKIVEFSLSSEDGEYDSGHIPGAINMKDTFNHVPGLRALAEYENVPMEEQLKFWNRNEDPVTQEMLENAGITKDTTVILYATTPATTAAYRAGMLMDYAGVKDIRFLNGGKTLWKLQGRELENEANVPEAVSFGATVPVNPDVVYDYDDELGVVEDENAVVASIRSWDEYIGKISGYTYIGEAGDIAKARFGYAGSDPYSMEDFRNIDNTTFNYEIIKDRWVRWGIVPEKRISFHCGTGWRASETYWYAKMMDYPDVHVYDGGWYEWSKMPDSPKKEPGVPEDAPEQKPEEFFIVKEK